MWLWLAHSEVDFGSGGRRGADPDKSEIRQVKGTRYVVLCELGGYPIAVYREISESKLKLMKE
jgi:hypothetical protein